MKTYQLFTFAILIWVCACAAFGLVLITTASSINSAPLFLTGAVIAFVYSIAGSCALLIARFFACDVLKFN